jgi:hypothetical protein
MGDGRHLCELSKDAQGNNALFIGIENNSTLYGEAAWRINADNVLLVNDNFESRIRELQDKTIDKVIMILPDPKYIDSQYHADWISLYANIFLKLKDLGILEIVTEIIDDLLQPVSDVVYNAWAKWLLQAFVSIGFGIEQILDRAPSNYTSTCLDRFRQDPQRIRVLTLRLFKPLAGVRQSYNENPNLYVSIAYDIHNISLNTR